MLGQACVIILAFADNIMIGWHSVEELAASSFVNNVMNLFILAELGFASGMTPIVGSFHGTGNVKGVGTTVKNGLALNGIVGLVGVVALTVIYFFLDCFGQEPELLPMICPYYIVVGVSTVFALGFNVLKQFTDGICRPVVSMLFLMFGNVMNIFGNWILIYGKMGLPEMGLLGAGISTLLSRALILVLFALYIWKSKDFKEYVSAFRASLLSRVKMKHLFGIGYPVAVQMALETSTFFVRGDYGGLARSYGTRCASGGHHHISTLFPDAPGTVVCYLHTCFRSVRQAGFCRYQGVCAERLYDDHFHFSGTFGTALCVPFPCGRCVYGFA